MLFDDVSSQPFLLQNNRKISIDTLFLSVSDPTVRSSPKVLKIKKDSNITHPTTVNLLVLLSAK